MQCRGAAPRGLLCLLFLAFAATLPAQGAQAVVLRIRPHPGDTLFTRFEQEVELIRTTRVGEAESTMTFRNSMLMLSHAVVQRVDSEASTVLAVTDSLAVSSVGGKGETLPEALRRSMQGKRLTMRITQQGSATVLDPPDDLTPDIQSLLSQMPATLPSQPVAVGQTWTQNMVIPVAGEGGPKGATLQSTYRLDSLSRDGTVAFISMHGTLSRDSTAAALPQGQLVSTGSVAGNLRVDRKRGWWTDSRATIAVRSVLTPPPTRPNAQPMHFQLKITQHMRTGRQQQITDNR